MFRLLFVLLGLSLLGFKGSATLGWALLGLTAVVWAGWVAQLLWAIATHAPPARR
ncbi:hypothetical protein HNQ51_001716 [Inhella inkyongensis]|uniref:Uncharacterized protein n=1 Tax=Inhella inkyongensis TaxID=392593 RepID=A0A840S4C0_9BURK|nr:hypothetical protein [Inhella inkyongensis]MBB5204402.1 hypothetical protein [Inhella inkyongensis]